MFIAILNKPWTPQSSSCTATYHPSRKLSKLDKPGHCWRSRHELISDVLLWTPTHGRVKAGQPARTYIQQLCEDVGCSPGDLLEAMNDREGWRERVKDIRADGMTRWWWFKVIGNLDKLSLKENRELRKLK